MLLELVRYPRQPAREHVECMATDKVRIVWFTVVILAASAIAVWMLPYRPSGQAAARAEHSWNDLKFLYLLLTLEYEDRADVPVRHFTSANPSWHELLRQSSASHDQMRDALEHLYRRGSIYQTSSKIVGRRWREIREDEVVVEIRHPPKDQPYTGIAKNGRIVIRKRVN